MVEEPGPREENVTQPALSAARWGGHKELERRELVNNDTLQQEGWGWLGNATKWHWFIRSTRRSLCGRWMFLDARMELEADGEASNKDCVECRRRLARKEARA